MRNLKFLLSCFMLLMSVVAFAQNQVTGHVADATGEPIIGANVTVKGTTVGTITDIDGNFTLEVGSTDGTLVVSFIGYKSAEAAIKGKSPINVILQEDTETLDEVVVVGYGTQNRKSLTGAISDVKSESLTRSVSTTTAGALSGKIAGISTRAKDARPGKGISLEIRNMGAPLYVIDGIPYGGNTGNDWLVNSEVSGNDVFNSLNIEDIESITVLKDASAAIYGLRASNGVVLVTTKKGKKNEKVSINVNGYYGWQNLTRFPELANAEQYTRGLAEAAQNRGEDPNSVYTKEELAKWAAGTEKGYKSYDYYDMIMRKNVPQYHVNASVTGGSERTNYYLSVAHTSQEAMMPDFNYQRTNFQLNLDTKITNRFTIGAQVSGRYEKTNDVGLPGGDGYYSAILAVFKMRPIDSPYANDNPNYIRNIDSYRNGYNPAAFRRDIAGYKDSMTRYANINAYAQYDFGFGLTAKATFSYGYTNSRFDGYQYAYQIYTYDEASDTYNGTNAAGRWRLQIDRSVPTRYMQLQLNYNKQIKDHNISAVLGYEASDYDWSKKTYGTEPSTDYLPLLQMDEINSFGDEWSYEARAGWLARVNYDYAHKYLVELLARYDGSYLYAPSQRWGFFPGASIGWRISEENFFAPLKSVVDDLKIRASIGQTGTESGVSLFGYLSGYNWNQGSAVLDGEYVTGLNQRGLPVTNLSWTKNTTKNIGFDLTMFGNRLTISADAFRKDITGVPAARYDVLLPSEVGYSLPNENLNKQAYVGTEAMATWTDHIGDFNYRVSGNITFSRYRNIESYKPRFSNSWDEYRNSSEDRWGGIYWGYQVIGQFQSEEEIKNYPVNLDGQGNTTLLPGDLIYKDVNNDGVINGMDERPIGFPEGWAPILSFGGNIGLEWKGIDLNIDFSGGAMQGWRQNYELTNAYHNGGNSPAYLLEDRWHRLDLYDPESEWVPGRYPAIRNGEFAYNNKNSDFWLHNVHYLRISNLEIGYSLPTWMLKPIHAQKVRIYGSVSNLCSFDNVHQYGIDPEITAAAAVVYPQQRTFLVGFNVTF
ncbi:SusC/RagA family TonB-linked outer membrane protein [Phocaeicola plebeius]|jgi:TonB-linked SusC/RagA family outer membrane protein|uniref:TonB-dependent receptor n=3 Tax=Bacteria TaxID=2 RepID=A0A3E4WM26_9BACT|nr:TonB-dependent receptor [Phocaeicola plebeius]MBS4809488.1 TonB-dependent receptor [Bacteroides sp.]MBD9353660.1 TonB-dependent receptor [Phocaeicola plebeius]MBS4823982.1 TonB-dependent receptor [Bacteroides sp.]RGK58422.1 TonB-dependent receptor [Phocaeicola plebeius]RGM43229.1 TonB-dependent receptor [Phocaeicola plebeius]